MLLYHVVHASLGKEKETTSLARRIITNKVTSISPHEFSLVPLLPPAYQQDFVHVFWLILEDKENLQHQFHFLEHEIQWVGFEPS